MKPALIIEKVKQLEKSILKQRRTSNTTKYQVASLFANIEKQLKYRIPTPPINVSEDGHKFECPTCGKKFDSEDIADDFNVCYICGQVWKEIE